MQDMCLSQHTTIAQLDAEKNEEALVVSCLTVAILHILIPRIATLYRTLQI